MTDITSFTVDLADPHLTEHERSVLVGVVRRNLALEVEKWSDTEVMAHDSKGRILKFRKTDHAEIKNQRVTVHLNAFKANDPDAKVLRGYAQRVIDNGYATVNTIGDEAAP
jgi:hypothetical protein